ncbi:MAG: hypothetical protein QOD42_2860 [Sphingomonadales bacterium]|nr:hypothetical protein [Sphingomonadales bacterium]
MAANLKPQFAARAEPRVRPVVSQSRPPGEKVADKESRVTARAVSHFEQNRRQWIAARYSKLLQQDAPAPALKPAGMGEDRAGRLHRAATHLVERKQASRLDRIKSAAERMVSGRATKEIGR